MLLSVYFKKSNGQRLSHSGQRLIETNHEVGDKQPIAFSKKEMYITARRPTTSNLTGLSEKKKNRKKNQHKNPPPTKPILNKVANRPQAAQKISPACGSRASTINPPNNNQTIAFMKPCRLPPSTGLVVYFAIATIGRSFLMVMVGPRRGATGRTP
jgi:hypothetical protein